ncbi:MAG: trigger factor [Desulfovibrionaceae bacterium]|nr:trigger factor [Desulfovibrionaceae bacterium]
MEHSIEVVSPVARKISVTVPAAGVNAVLDSTVRGFGASLSLDGFRKGKVPARVIERRFPEEIASRATESLVNGQVSGILAKEHLNPVNRLEFDAGAAQVERDKEFSFSFSFEVLPDSIVLPEDMGALSVEVEAPDLKPEEVESLTRRLLGSMAELEEVSEARLPRDDDVVLVDVDATLDGTSVPGMSAANFRMKLHAPEEGETRAELENLVRTLHAGEEGEGDMTAPEDYPDPSLRGKTVHLKVKLHTISREVLPELNDELARKVGLQDESALRGAIREQAMLAKQREIRAKSQQKLLDSLLDAQDFPLPPSLVDRHLREYLAEAREYLARQGLDEKAVAGSLEKMKAEGEVRARMQAKAQAFLMALAYRENIQVTPQETDRSIFQMARESGQDFAKLREAVWRSGAVHDIQERLITAKALDLLYSRAKKIEADSAAGPEAAATAETTEKAE